MKDIIASFKKKIKDYNDYLVLVTAQAKDYQDTKVKLIRFLIEEKKFPGIYVSLNKPYDIVERSLKKEGIDPRVIIFIDGATHIKGKDNKRKDNCLFIGSPEKLSDISVAMDQAVKAMPDEKFVFFDSINTLSIFNNKNTVARFIHYLTGKMREWKVKGIIMSLEDWSEKLILDELTQLSDARIDIN